MVKYMSNLLLLSLQTLQRLKFRSVPLSSAPPLANMSWKSVNSDMTDLSRVKDGKIIT